MMKTWNKLLIMKLTQKMLKMIVMMNYFSLKKKNLWINEKVKVATALNKPNSSLVLI